MGTAVKRTISLPPELSELVDEWAEENGKSASAVIQDALRRALAERRRAELDEIRGFWSRKAAEKGVLTEEDLDRLSNARSRAARPRS